MLSSRSIMVAPRRIAPPPRDTDPHRCDDGLIVRVDQVSAHVAVAGEMKLAHAAVGMACR